MRIAAAEHRIGSGTAWHARLRDRGYRLTPQRQLVLEAVAALGHATPDEVAERVRSIARGVNISTVYRTLDLLEQVGLVTHAHLGHGPATYHVVSDDTHLHLVCHSCGAVVEESVEIAAPLTALVRSRHGFEVDLGHLSVAGLCAACARDRRAPRVAGGDER